MCGGEGGMKGSEKKSDCGVHRKSKVAHPSLIFVLVLGEILVQDNRPLCSDMCLHSHTCTHIHTYTHVHTYTHTHMQKHTPACAIPTITGPQDFEQHLLLQQIMQWSQGLGESFEKETFSAEFFQVIEDSFSMHQNFYFRNLEWKSFKNTAYPPWFLNNR